MFKILFTDNVEPNVLQLLDQQTDVTYEMVTRLTQEAFRDIIVDYDGVVVRSSVKVDAPILEAGPRLKVVVRAGVGVDNVDIPTATKCGVLVMNTPAANTITTAEHTIGLLLALARHIPQAYLSMTEGKWDRKKYGGMELAEKTLGLIGLGRIGLHVAKVTNALGMRVIAYDPYIATAVAEAANVAFLSFDEVLAQADFLSLHSVLNDETRGMIDAAAIVKMKDGARIVNTARGALINDAALVAALESGKIAGAALDTFAVEPLAVDSPYRHLPQVISTPHLAASTTEAQLRAGSLAVARMLAFFRGEDYGLALNNPA